eukprot:gene19017-biopygen19012
MHRVYGAGKSLRERLCAVPYRPPHPPRPQAQQSGGGRPTAGPPILTPSSASLARGARAAKSPDTDVAAGLSSDSALLLQ